MNQVNKNVRVVKTSACVLAIGADCVKLEARKVPLELCQVELIQYV